MKELPDDLAVMGLLSFPSSVRYAMTRSRRSFNAGPRLTGLSFVSFGRCTRSG